MKKIELFILKASPELADAILAKKNKMMPLFKRNLGAIKFCISLK
jgi:hypothetical protein